MAGIDEVLERLVADADFRAALAGDPAAALAGYDLTRGDVELLASRLDEGDDAERTVEQRTSKSAMLALLASFAGPGGGGTAGSGHGDQIDVLSWSWGDTSGQDGVPDDLAVPDGDADELYNKSQGKVEYTWKVEEGVKAEIDPDALMAEDGPGATAPGVPSTDDEGIIVINGLEDDDSAPAETVGLNFSKVHPGEAPLDPALGDAGHEPEEAVEVFLKVGDVKGEAVEPAASVPAEELTDVGGVKAEVDPDALTHKVDPGDEGIITDDQPGAVDEVSWSWGETSEGVVGGSPPDDGIVGGNPPDDTVVGGNPPDDTVVGATPSDDTVVGANPPDDNLGARTDVTAAMDVDDVMEIEDV